MFQASFLGRSGAAEPRSKQQIRSVSKLGQEKCLHPHHVRRNPVTRNQYLKFHFLNFLASISVLKILIYGVGTFQHQPNLILRNFHLFVCFYYFYKTVEGSVSDCLISASSKTPSAAKHTNGCASPHDIESFRGLSKTMEREPSYCRNCFKTSSFHENQRCCFL